MQGRRNSIANALELCLSCTNPGGGYSEKILWGCAARVFVTIPLATETKGQIHTLGYGKWVKIKP